MLSKIYVSLQNNQQQIIVGNSIQYHLDNKSLRTYLQLFLAMS